MAESKQHKNSKKKLYYISAEFLIGKLLSNNLINLGIYDDVKKELADFRNIPFSCSNEGSKIVFYD